MLKMNLTIHLIPLKTETKDFTLSPKTIPSKLRYTFLDFGSGVAHISRVFKNSLKKK